MPPDQVTEGQLFEAQGKLNAFMIGCEAASALQHAESMSGSEDDVIATVKDLQNTLIKAKEQAEGDDGELDYKRVKMFSGTPQQKAEKIMEINSKLNGAQRALTQKREEANQKAEADRIAEANNGGSAAGGTGGALDTTVRAAPVTSAAIEKQLEERHNLKFGSTEFKEAALQGSGISLEVPMGVRDRGDRGIVATVFETSHWDQNVVYERGWLPSRGGEHVPIQVIQLLHSGPMESKNMTYWQEKVYNPAVAGRAEKGVLGESQYEMEKKSFTPISIGHHLPITEEALEDRDELMDYVDYVMPLGVLQKLDQQVVGGDGSSLQFRGIMRIGYTKKNNDGVSPDVGNPGRHFVSNNSGESKWDELLLAKTSSMDFGTGILGMQMPTHAVVTTKYWTDCLTAKSTAGGYLIGGPAQALFAMPWGMNLSVCTNSALSDADSTDAAGANNGNLKMSGFIFDNSPMFHKVYYRHGITVRFGMINDDFTRLQLRVRAEVRGQFVVKRAAAFTHLVNKKSDKGDPTVV